MSKQWEKYILKMEISKQKKMHDSIRQVISLNFNNLDIKKLQNESNLYRCRVGKNRIIFSLYNNKVKIKYIGSRGDIYK